MDISCCQSSVRGINADTSNAVMMHLDEEFKLLINTQFCNNKQFTGQRTTSSTAENRTWIKSLFTFLIKLCKHCSASKTTNSVFNLPSFVMIAGFNKNAKQINKNDMNFSLRLS
uniref:Uncharacterized protein n=1 Tax=Glossina austeni TaxID=7395 RepID=A0A1A9VLB0_GLOAU